MVYPIVLVPFLICIPAHVFARPPRTVPYFPQYNPWNPDDVGIHSEESKWNYMGSPEVSPELSKYFYSFDPSDKQLKDSSLLRGNMEVSMPVYEKGKGGFVPPSMSALDKVYWWDKRFGNFDIPLSEDLPYFNDQDEPESTVPVHGSMKKRDYTAVQLVNMLKALAKARRQRQIRIAGKGLRFGISR